MDQRRADWEICLDALRAARLTLSRRLDPLSEYSPTVVLDAVIELLDSDEIDAAMKRIDCRTDLRVINCAVERRVERQPHGATSVHSPLCIKCNVLREPIQSEPVAPRYEIRSYECPACKSMLKLVERTEPSLFPRF